MFRTCYLSKQLCRLAVCGGQDGLAKLRRYVVPLLYNIAEHHLGIDGQLPEKPRVQLG